MSKEKKFLDAEGVKYLWSKINMQDYPNNETLMDVIEAIDETKADRSELFSGSWNDLKDKPFGNIIGQPLFELKFYNGHEYTFEVNDDDNCIYEQFHYLGGSPELLNPETAYVFVDGEGVIIGSFETREELNWDIPCYIKDVYGDNRGVLLFCAIDNGTGTYGFIYNETYIECPAPGLYSMYYYEDFDTFYVCEGNFKQLDEAYIPDTIARVSDIPEHTWATLPDKPIRKEKVYTKSFNSSYGYMLSPLYNFVSSDSFLITVNDIEYLMNKTTEQDDGLGYTNVYYENENCPIYIRVNTAVGDTTIHVTGDITYPYTLSIWKEYINSNIIDKDIARVRDITWNNLPDKPFYTSMPISYNGKQIVEGNIWDLNYFDFVVGADISIQFDSDFYMPTVQDDTDEYYSRVGIGNKALSDSTKEDTGEPFYIQLTKNWGGYIWFNDDQPHDISISGSMPIVKYIDSQVIGPDIARVANLLEVANEEIDAMFA